MTLNLLLSRRRADGDAIIFADPLEGGIEPVLAGLVSQLGDVHRVMFPLPDETTRRHVPPPSLLRRRHADLWHALSEDERSRAVLIAGPTAAYLAPVLGPSARTFVAVRDPREAAGPVAGAWRPVLGPFADLDDVPEAVESDAERDEWVDRIRAATGGLDLVRVSDIAGVAAEVAGRLGLRPRAVAAAASVAAAEAEDVGDAPRRDGSVDWLDEALFSLSSPPEPQLPRKARRRRAAASPPSAGSSTTKGRSPKRRRR